MKNRLVAWLHGNQVPTALSIGVIAVAVLAVSMHALQQRIEAPAFDARMRATLQPQEIDPMVVIVDIDEKSLAAEGHWPWQRAKIAQLVKQIEAAGAQSIVFDLTFPEADRNPADELLAGANDLDPAARAAVEAQREAVDQDRILAETLAASSIPTVLGFAFTKALAEGRGALPASTVHYDGDIDRTSFLEFKAPVGNLPVLQEAASSGGFFTLLEDPDGVVRRVPTVVRHGDKLYASIELEAMRLALGVDAIQVVARPAGDRFDIERVVIGELEIPTDRFGQVIVPYRGPSPQFLYLSAADVLHGRIEDGAMAGSIVLVGTSAESMKDLRSTPVQQSFAGVEVHANTIFTLFTNEVFPHTPAEGVGVDVAVILLCGLVATVLFGRLRPLAMIVVSFLLLGLVVGTNLWLWKERQLVLSLAIPVVMLVTITFLFVNSRFLSEARSRRNLRDSFGQYVPAARVEQMYRDPDKDFGFDGESREMSVLFSDIRGFTSLSEKLDPQALKQFLNAWFTPVTELIQGRDGTIDKYVGDMVMAFWGAPLRDADHRQHAIEAALDILATLPRMQQEFAARGWPSIDVGVGINSGAMNVGDMGSTFRRAYTVIGDTVNLGSRLEGLTKHYGVKLIVGEATALQTTGIVYRELDRVRAKGKAEPVTILEAVCREAEANNGLHEELRMHHAALQHYFAGDWPAAEQEFSALATAHPGRRCYALYLERIAELRESIAAGAWDGVYEHTTK